MRRKGGWYEEDCEAHIVFVFLPVARDESQREEARRGCRNYFPDEWMAATGEVLTPDQSHVLEERAFRVKHAEDYVSVAAVGSWHAAVPEGMVGCTAVPGKMSHLGYAREHARCFLVPADEYSGRGLKFVIDLQRHQEVPARTF